MAKWISLILLKRIMQCKTVNKDWICSNVQIDKRRHEECYLFLLIFIFIANWVEYNSVLGLRVTRYSQNFIRLSANRSFGRSLAVISTVIFIFWITIGRLESIELTRCGVSPNGLTKTSNRAISVLSTEYYQRNLPKNRIKSNWWL